MSANWWRSRAQPLFQSAEQFPQGPGGGHIIERFEPLTPSNMRAPAAGSGLQSGCVTLSHRRDREPRLVKSVSLRRKEVPMLARVNRQILLKSRPEGVPSLDNFVLKQGSVPEPGDGEVLMRTRWLSLDPRP
jgi:N-terminal domain of oxidoreductase